MPPRARTARDALEPWLARRRAALEAIGALVEPLARRGGPRERVLASVLRARVTDDLIEQLDRAPIAREVERDPDLLAAYRAALASATGPLVEEAARAYRVCAEPAPMRVWSRSPVREGARGLSIV